MKHTLITLLARGLPALLSFLLTAMVISSGVTVTGVVSTFVLGWLAGVLLAGIHNLGRRPAPKSRTLTDHLRQLDVSMGKPSL